MYKKTTFYASLEQNICYVDTRGTEDIDSKTNDETILNNIQREMHSYNGNKCKFIWIVVPTKRKKDHLKYQASFIQKFGKNHNNTNTNSNNNNNDEKETDEKYNIWDSVLMVVSEPKVNEPLTTEVQGAIDLAVDYGCNQNHWKTGKNLLGFTNLSWIEA